MARRRKKKPIFLPILCILLWVSAISLLGCYYLFAAPRDSAYSEEENRTLAGFPEVSVENIFSGDFGQQMESYLLDHFPGRSSIIDATNQMQNMVSFASHDEYLLIAEGPQDLLDEGDYAADVDDLLSGFAPEETEAPVPAQTESKPSEAATEAPTEATKAPEDPPIEPKPEAKVEDFPGLLNMYLDTGKGDVAYQGFSRSNVAAVTAVLNKYAACLPEDGKLMFTVVPQSTHGNRFVNASNPVRFHGDWDDVVNGLGADNVYAFDAADILTPAIQNGDYVYFRTDMHWTPYGSYLVYSQMAERAGKTPCSYTEDFDITVEEPFRGTYYRDNPAAYMSVAPDRLDLLMPKFPLEWRRITAGDEYKLIDFLDFNAKANDRYTVYLGGPAGPWTYAECDNGETENCLVLTDSFGLGFIPFLTCNYKQVHYYDARYYDYAAVDFTVADMIEKYDIQDIYVVVGDLHSFDSSFILSNANKQLFAE